jgi:hypothetical protein
MRKMTTTSILNDDELAILANGIHQLVGESVTLAIEAYGLDLEAIQRTEGVSVSAEGHRGESRRVSGSSRADPVHRIT